MNIPQTASVRGPVHLSRPAPDSTVLPGFVTGDAATRAAITEALLFARSDLPLLVEGPSGCGKELIAEGLHRASGRTPWVPVNCGALPESLQEAELFGVKRGAFTGAATDRRGLVEEAAGGTLFLDEVGEMPPAMQAKLLRFLELGEIRRLGDTSVRQVCVRVIAATNRDLVEEVRAGRFRNDLYYRLCGASVRVVGLDDRPGDISLLARHFLGSASSPRVHESFFEALTARRWPGNARELKFLVARAALVAKSQSRPLSAGDVTSDGGMRPARSAGNSSADAPVGSHPDATFADRVAAYEKRLIERALRRTGWNKARAARDLGGLKRTTLLGKMRRLGIADVEPAPDSTFEGLNAAG